MNTILLLIITLILGLDFYINHKKLIKRVIKDILKEIKGEKAEFSINKKGAGDKAMEDLEKETNDFIIKM